MQKTIVFYSSSKEYGEFSNLFPAEITFNGRKWKSVEHIYQYLKINPANKDWAEWLITAPETKLVAMAGHGLSPYKKYLRDNWDDIKRPIMRYLVALKYSQNQSLGDLLRKTGGAMIIEDSKYDSYWGRGEDGTGDNVLGVLLMELRVVLSRQYELQSDVMEIWIEHLETHPIIAKILSELI